MLSAWSNGQTIQLDLKTNRYLGSAVEEDGARQELQAANVAFLQASSSRNKPLYPGAKELMRYFRSAWLARKICTKPLSAQIDYLVSTKNMDVSEGDPEELAWSFQLMRNLRPTRPACLEDSVGCALYLRGRVSKCQFCIGVRQPPFMAHAWVQVGDLIINDTKGAVESYSPIIRVEL